MLGILLVLFVVILLVYFFLVGCKVWITLIARAVERGRQRQLREQQYREWKQQQKRNRA